MLFFRHALGLTQDQFARKLGVGLRTYQRYESGMLMPRADFAYKFARAVGVSVDYLFSVDRVGRKFEVRELDLNDQEEFCTLFLPSLDEIENWRNSAGNSYISTVLEKVIGARDSKNSQLFVGGMTGIHLSPDNVKETGRSEFLKYLSSFDLEFMADIWGNILSGRLDNFIVRYQTLLHGEPTTLVSWNKVVIRNLDKTFVFGSEINLNGREDLLSEFDKLFDTQQ